MPESKKIHLYAYESGKIIHTGEDWYEAECGIETSSKKASSLISEVTCLTCTHLYQSRRSKEKERV